jgi:hypothetical protein
MSGFSGSSVGDPLTMAISFHSNPGPNSILWYMHDLNGSIEVENITQAVNSKSRNNVSARYRLGELSRVRHIMLRDLLTQKCAHKKKVTDFGCRFRKHQIENRFPDLALSTFFKT